MLAFIIILVLAALVVQRYTLARGLEGVAFAQEPSASTVEPDEEFVVNTILENRSRRFIPFIELVENLPKDVILVTQGVEVRQVSKLDQSDVLQMLSTVYLMPRQRLVRQVKASLPRRGRYFLRGATLRLGDFLGLTEESESFNDYREIVVIPKTAQLPGTMETLGGFLGDISVNRFILEDPVLTLGFREYTMREPQKMISWSQSARRGQLMVKKYDYTLELSVTVLLNVQCGDGGTPAPGIGRDALLEHCFSLARSVCEYLEEKGVQYDFMTNATAAGAFSHWSSIGEGLGYRHLATILEGLGRATYTALEPFDFTLEKAAQRAQQGRSYILITPQDLPEYRPGLDRLRDLTGGDVHTLEAQKLIEAGSGPEQT